MIKLIISDVDGTLVPEGDSRVNPALLEEIRQISSRGVRFVVASGRQYDSVRKAFTDVFDDVMFIADNGGLVYEKGQLLACNTFKENDWKEILRYLHTIPDDLNMVSTVEGSYSDRYQDQYLRWLEEGYRIPIQRVEDITRLDLQVIKLAAYCTKGDAVAQAGPLTERFGEIANVLVSGENWVDFVVPGTDKGHALAKVQEHFGILPEETMAFGDQINDIGMLLGAGESYAVAGARPEVKAVVRHVMDEGPEQDGVLHVLQKYFG